MDLHRLTMGITTDFVVYLFQSSIFEPSFVKILITFEFSITPPEREIFLEFSIAVVVSFPLSSKIPACLKVCSVLSYNAVFRSDRKTAISNKLKIKGQMLILATGCELKTSYDIRYEYPAIRYSQKKHYLKISYY